VEVMETLSLLQIEELRAGLLAAGFELMDDKKAVLIEKIKNIIIQMVHHSDELIKVNFSNYLSETLHHDYNYLSNLFTEVQGMNITQFTILHKVERVKELIIYGDLNLTEISYKLHYSSVAHLSNQFKKVTGISPSDFKQLKTKVRISIDDIGTGTSTL
jgi:AraC-like DNA-binding protein